MVFYKAKPIPAKMGRFYAMGPWVHLFQGTYEQSYLYHVMNYAAQILSQAAMSDKR
jgi:hypothetical protein